ncbi:Pkr1p KNAG_0E02250 [Huiozyma naganishii CBS 8797]|uniref:Uncharacterized protein n=1 Tax=Huiozyma naganishii (strain ATCC MYA-139 / BCRC 22969 / CBS 8797 / KCTC 17520 / NBRC 10181 / NCYC 3082 / Yp74L-3) TaxID=1071383 RepID=J7S7T9_HUIN7|nr:hypothetical protein KNAG_0E02250 [Kazachstania naganishii CBS 8797]CCK70486.1 hypothetical protein KNAG_0E02250 [Kazachstania naganishii CBS 8797]
MASFFVQLWDSIFQPGTTPQLVIATHASFTALLLTLGWLIYVTQGNIHFIMLALIASLLWAAVGWFIVELSRADLKKNEELTQESKESLTGDGKTTSESATATGQKLPSQKNSTRSRKL